jgi:hypothetical protein
VASHTPRNHDPGFSRINPFENTMAVQVFHTFWRGRVESMINSWRNQVSRGPLSMAVSWQYSQSLIALSWNLKGGISHERLLDQARGGCASMDIAPGSWRGPRWYVRDITGAQYAQRRYIKDNFMYVQHLTTPTGTKTLHIIALSCIASMNFSQSAAPL